MIDLILFDKPRYDFEFKGYIKVDIIRAKNVRDLKKSINKARGLRVVEVNSPSVIRAAVEDKRVDIIIGQERIDLKDHQL